MRDQLDGSTSSIDDQTNYFLSESSFRTKVLGLEPILQPAELPSKADSLHRLSLLVQRRAWNDVLLLTEQLLHGSVNTHVAPIYASLLCNNVHGELALDSHKTELVWIMTVHLKALVKLKYYQKLNDLLKSWVFCHHHGSTKLLEWIPWNLHIAAASSLFFTSSVSLAIDELWNIRTSILRSGDVGSVVITSVALLQVYNSLTNIFIMERNWRMALETLERMMEQDKTNEKSDILSCVCQEDIKRHKEKSKVDHSTLRLACVCEILSRQGRILLQAGALPEAEQIYRRANALWDVVNGKIDDNTFSSIIVLKIIPVQLKINWGLLSVSHSKHDEGLEHFQSAIQLIQVLQKDAPESFNTHMMPTLPEKWLIDSQIMTPIFLLCDNTCLRDHINLLYSDAVNNVALCALYTCRLVDAVDNLESLVRQDPTAYLTERVAMNLCTLYELGSESNESTRKKKVLQHVGSRFSLHDIGPECFRIVA